MPSPFQRFAVALALLAPCAAAQAAQVAWTAEDFVTVSGPASPPVAVALRQEAARLVVAVEVTGFAADGADTRIALGAAAGKPVTLTGKQATTTHQGARTRYEFAIPLTALGGDLRTLRLGLAAAWAGAGGSERQRERLRHLGGAAHDGLATDAAQWQPFDLTEYTQLVADRRNRITVPITQPMDGKATVVIEGEDGHRIRNLIGGLPLAKGAQRIAWDGLDDHGVLVAPGTYRWRSLHHPGIVPDYLMNYGDGDNTVEQLRGWGPNHMILTAAAASGSWTVMAAPMTEGGHSIVVLDADGKKLRGMNQPMGMGMAKTAPAIIGDTLYVANDGLGWGQNLDEKDAKAVTRMALTLARFDLKTGQLKEYDGKRFREVFGAEVGPGAADKGWREVSLTGMAAIGERLYIGNRRSAGILVVDPATGAKLDEIPLPAPGALTAANGRLFAISAEAVVAIDPATRKTTTVIPAGALKPMGLAVDATGTIYVSDAASSTVHVFSAAGKPLRQLGKPGGMYTGPYDAQRMVDPRGLALAANGWLWVTEDCPTPKRILAWDPAKGTVVCEKFGTAPYGGSGGGFDAADHTRTLGMGTQWRIDPAKGTSAPINRLGRNVEGAMNYSYVRDHGVTYLIGMGGVTTITRLNDDGTNVPVAMIASAHRYSYGHDWKPPQEFIAAFNQAYPDRLGKHGDKGPGFVWTDRNGDGKLQAVEFDFATACEDFAGGYFGHGFHDLTLTFPARVKGRTVLMTLKPTGFTAAGAPQYPALNGVAAVAPPIALEGNQLETTTDRFGDLLCNSDPEMRAFAPDGRLLWTYPNRWSSVHGSHKAPLPEIGVTQGTLFFLGTAPLDKTSDVFVMNGNHGRFFMLTSDGLYVDEMFKDCRMGGDLGPNLIGGECFGGSFGRSAKDGNYYLLAGSFRVYRLNGVAQAVRDAGTITITPAQIMAAERALTARASTAAASTTATIPLVASAPVIDGKDGDWPSETKAATAAWDRSGQFKVRVRAAYDAKDLFLCYDVEDGSPWVNNGKDWTLLFKSGDSVDLQLGTAPGANPGRSGPVAGDLRLLIAPSQGKDIAVLYRHRLPGAKDPVTFTCPWRSETVDSVSRIDDARIAVTRDGGRYRVEAAIPLAALGLKTPTGRTCKADFGAIFGDPDGQINMLRSYWANQNTGLVNDVPGEIMLTPGAWGSVTFSGTTAGAAP